MSEEGEPAPVETPVEEEKPAEEPAAEEPKAEESAPAASCSGECPCKMITEPFEKSKFFEQLKEIFMWKDLMKSLAVFCAINVFFVLLICYDFTVLGLICWVAFFALLAALAMDCMRVIAYFKDGKNEESKIPIKEIPLPVEIIDGLFDLVKEIFKAFLGVCINAVLVKDVVFSVSMVFGFLFIIYLAGHMGLTGMVYALLLFSFIWFRLYNDHKEAVDNLFAKLKAFVKEQFDKLKEMINKPKSQ